MPVPEILISVWITNRKREENFQIDVNIKGFRLCIGSV